MLHVNVEERKKINKWENLFGTRDVVDSREQPSRADHETEVPKGDKIIDMNKTDHMFSSFVKSWNIDQLSLTAGL